jgi:hypothetical protein
MSRNTVFILSNVTETTCNSQRLKNNIVNAMGNNGYLAQNMLTRPVNESLTCNAYLGKGCELIDGGESGANTIDHCLVGVDLTKSPNAGAGNTGTPSNSDAIDAVVDLEIALFLDYNASWIFGLGPSPYYLQF